jgi:hypothetical protein
MIFFLSFLNLGLLGETGRFTQFPATQTESDVSLEIIQSIPRKPKPGRGRALAG